jgi:hypothetical protein
MSRTPRVTGADQQSVPARQSDRGPLHKFVTLDAQDRFLAVAASMRRLPLSRTKSPIVLPGDRTRGREPSCGGSRPIFGGVGGTRPPRLSLWETGKGNQDSLLPQAVLFRPPFLSTFLATADSPCFHSHSCWSICSRCQLVFSISNGCCHLGIELSLSCENSFRRDLAVTRTRRFATKPKNSSGRFLFRCLAIPQRFIHCACDP